MNKPGKKPGQSPVPHKIALVLAGGAARGAYEVGVVDYVLEKVARDVGPIRFDILCGTSVGALNACGLAAFADDGAESAKRLANIWQKLDVTQLVSFDVKGVLGMSKRWLGRGAPQVPAREGGLIDPTGLENLITNAIPFDHIKENLKAGLVEAVTVSTTHVQSGRTVVFVERADGTIPRWSRDPTIEPRAAVLGPQHALASAAVPILFRAIRIDGEYHCDGGLRQNVPLSPARRLGADAVLVVNPRRIDDDGLAEKNPAVEEQFPSPFFLLGKTLNALLLDRIDTDLARLEGINRILAAGTRAYGKDFIAKLNQELGYSVSEGRGLRTMRATLVRASQDIGKMASEYVQSAHFSRVGGFLGGLMRRIAESDSSNEADLLSYLLFDGPFAGQLIELGRQDAAAQHDDLCKFFSVR
ncbi:MAG: patatin-like phospholipase family protein [Polyangiaceae bacterium]